MIEYYNKHAVAADLNDSYDLESFQREFIRVNMSTILKLIMATDMIASNMSEQIRKEFNLPNDHDFTPEEEKQMRCENARDYE